MQFFNHKKSSFKVWEIRPMPQLMLNYCGVNVSWMVDMRNRFQRQDGSRDEEMDEVVFTLTEQRINEVFLFVRAGIFVRVFRLHTKILGGSKERPTTTRRSRLIISIIVYKNMYKLVRIMRISVTESFTNRVY